MTTDTAVVPSADRDRSWAARVLGLWLLPLVAVAAGTWLLRDIPSEAAGVALHGVPAHPYLVWSHAPLLYVATPLAVLCASFLFYAPGLHLVLAFGRENRAGPMLLKAFVVGLGCLALWTALVTVVAPSAGRGMFIGGWIALALGTWSVWLHRARHGLSTWPWSDPVERRRIGVYLGLPILVVVTLLPILFWQDLNADGSEALEIGRSLRWFVVPRFLDGNGFIGLGIGMIPMAYPVHWFDQLFGSIEAAARLPLALYLPALLAAAVALIEVASPRRLHMPEFLTVLLGLGLFVFVLGYNASYDNYFADLSSPAAFEAFTVFTVLAAAYALWADEFWWFLWLALLSFIARPTGVLLVGLLSMGAAWATPELRGRVLRWLPAALLLWVAVFLLYEKAFVPWASGGVAGYGSGSITRRFQYIRFDHLGKLVWVVVPAGIVPAVACLAIRRLDPIGRALLVAAGGYFAVFYFPAFTNLHHFAPVMILPVVIYWRAVLTWTSKAWPTWAALAGIVVAFVVSRPRHFEVNQAMRPLGWATEYRVGGYEGPADAYRASVDALGALYMLFRPEWDVSNPGQEQVGGAHQWYYAVRPKPEGVSINYLVQPAAAPAPPDFQLVGTRDGVAAFVRDANVWEADRFRSRRTDFRNGLYQIPREVRFDFLGIPAGRYAVNLAELPGLWRLF